MKNRFLLFLVLCSIFGYSQEQEFNSKEVTINAFVDGTLLTPNSSETETLAIIIAGSGPTDRDGNQNFMKNNSLKKLAEALSKNGIATFRYDKRIVKQIKKGNPNVNILFDDFVTDAISVVDYFKKDNTYKKIYVIGHSQGSLVGLLAAKERADGFISIAGAGRSIDEVIIEQIKRNAPMFIEDTKRVFNVLKEGKTTEEYPPALASIFNIGVQPFIMNWMSYNPQEIIKSLKIPALILNGTKDIQITEEDAKLLKEAQPNAQLSIIENMNHVLFTILGDSLENYKSYNESYHDVSSELISVILNFIDPLK